LDKDIPDIWKRKGVGSDFGAPLLLSVNMTKKYINEKEMAKIYFFTDGIAGYPRSAINQIEGIIQGSD